MRRKYKYLVLAIGFAFLGGVTGKVEAVCDIENVCQHVLQEKKDKKTTPHEDDEEPTSDNNVSTLDEKETTPNEKELRIDQETKQRITRKCGNEDPVGSKCPMKQVIEFCWDKKNTATVVKQCKED